MAGAVQRPVAPVMSQADVENVKKCKNFFSTLLRLASQQPPQTLNTVKKLIQNLLVCSVSCGWSFVYVFLHSLHFATTLI